MSKLVRLRGLPPQIPSLIGIVSRVGEERVRNVAKVGIPDATPPMPPHPNLTETEMDDLIAFLRGGDVTLNTLRAGARSSRR